MKTTQKEIIAAEVAQLAERTSQNRVAVKVGISSAAVSQIINRNWQYIGTATWRLIEVRLRLDSKWKTAETSNFRGIIELLTAAQQHGLSLGISYAAGAGKSHTYRAYAREHDNVFLIECANYWTKREYVSRLLAEVGAKVRGTTSDMVAEFIRQLNSTHKPLVIIDQIDKLRDPSLDLFMDMYNETHHRCGFLLSGVEAFEKRVLNGVNHQRIGYGELYSRIGRKFVKLSPLTRNDVYLICAMNGLEDEDLAIEIYNACEGDIRRVRRSVEQHHLLTKKKSVAITK